MDPGGELFGNPDVHNFSNVKAIIFILRGLMHHIRTALLSGRIAMLVMLYVPFFLALTWMSSFGPILFIIIFGFPMPLAFRGETLSPLELATKK